MKGIRESILKEEEKETEESVSHIDPNSTYPYEGKDPYPDRDYSVYTLEPLELGQIRITIKIPIVMCGKVGNPDNEKYNNDLMLKKAEQLALIEIKKFKPDLKQIENTYSEEGIDEIEVSFTILTN